MLIVLLLLIASIAVSAQSFQGPRGRGMAPQTETEKGLLVTGIVSDSPAERAGLMRGDILLAIEGEEVNTPAELHETLTDLKAGQRIRLGITRGGESKTINLTLEDRLNRPAIGLQFAQGRRILDIEDGTRAFMGGFGGVMVAEVVDGSPADNAGLEEGDVIIAIDGDEVNPMSLAEAVQAHKPGDVITVTIGRDDESTVDKRVTLGKGEDNRPLLGVRYHVGPQGFGNRDSFRGRMDDMRGRMDDMREHMENESQDNRPWRSAPAQRDQDA